MSRRIGVSGGCQTGGIVDALKLLLPEDEIRIVGMQIPTPDEEFFKNIRDIDVLLTAVYQYIDCSRLEIENPVLKVIRWPQLYFRAFHPDITMASYDNTAIRSMGCPYVSNICLWGWLNNLNEGQIIRLYNKDVFAALGYFDLWDHSVASLRADFERCNLSFQSFFLPVQRQGVFMHADSHAKLSPIVHVARQLAGQLGADARRLAEPIEDYLADPLIFDTVWPVYPAIGENLSVPSCYRWKYRSHHCSSLEEYIAISCSDFNDLQLDREVLTRSKYTPQMNALMSRFVG